MSKLGQLDLGEANPEREGAYRRGFHQAIAEVAYRMSESKLTAADLEAWVNGDGMTWRKDTPLSRMIEPPTIQAQS